MNWKNRKVELPPNPGWYLVYCVAYQWSACWPTVAFWNGKQFVPKDGDKITADIRVEAWCEIERPEFVDCGDTLTEHQRLTLSQLGLSKDNAE